MPSLMTDSISVASLNSTKSDEEAGYVDGHWPTYAQARKDAPAGKPVLAIACFAQDDADCLDIENGDATNSEAAAWVKRQLARGLVRPVLYTSVSNAMALLATLAAAGISRSQVRLWLAHYTFRSHICGPACGFGLNTLADATQFSDSDNNCDASLVADGFFAPAPVAPVATKTQEGNMIASSAVGGSWTARADGAVFAIDGAPFKGSMFGHPLDQPIVGIAGTPSGQGYWLVGADGGVFAFGDAAPLGGLTNHPEWNAGAGKTFGPCVGIAAGGPHDAYAYVLVCDNGAAEPYWYRFAKPAAWSAVA